MSFAAIQRLLGSFDAGLLRLLELEDSALPWVAKFLQRYRKLGAQGAGAALIYLAESEGIETVSTLDRRDFSIYRPHRNRSLHLLPLLSRASSAPIGPDGIRSLNLFKGLMQVGDDVFYILDTDGNPNQSIRDAEAFPFLWRYAGVRHRGGMRDQGFDSPQTFRQ